MEYHIEDFAMRRSTREHAKRSIGVASPCGGRKNSGSYDPCWGGLRQGGEVLCGLLKFAHKQMGSHVRVPS